MSDAQGVDPGELAKFGAMAPDWWDPKGKFAPLHAMNPCRLDYIRGQILAETGGDGRGLRALEGVSVLDVGCGGGLLSEPMARMGAAVTGIDPGGASLPVARAHAEASGLAIDYRDETAGAVAARGARFDAVLAMEVIEHVPDPAGFIAECADCVAEGGLLIVSTLNRTPRSFALAIVGAEWLLGWLPRGTHDWRRFVTPEETARMAEMAGLSPVDATGMVRDPLSGDWHLSPDNLSVNYVVTAVRRRGHADARSGGGA